MEVSDDVERSFKEIEGGFKKIVKRRQKMDSSHGGHHHDRSFVSEMALQRVNEDTIIILITPLHEDHEDACREKKTIRASGSVSEGSSIEAKETVAIRLRGDVGKTKVDFSFDTELGFGVSQRAVKRFVERRLEEIIGVSIYFQRLVPLKEYKVEDGVALAQDLLWMAISGKKRAGSPPSPRSGRSAP